jgi:hypothetical protein
VVEARGRVWTVSTASTAGTVVDALRPPEAVQYRIVADTCPQDMPVRLTPAIEDGDVAFLRQRQSTP